VRATLHDELMREAGFESDYYAGLERRREHRRRKLKVDLLRAARVTAFVGAVAGSVAAFIDMDGKTDHLPRALMAAVLALATIGGVAQLLERRMTRGHPPRRLRRLWRGITRPWRSDSR
jgi:hypothetical protein